MKAKKDLQSFAPSSLGDEIGVLGKLYEQQKTKEEQDYFETIMVCPAPNLIDTFE
jgi:hypothetical protein